MSDTQTMVRTQIIIDDHGYFLAQGQDLVALEKRIEDAVRGGGRFERFIVVGNREMSVLFTATSRVCFSVETVQYDPRDTGDAAEPFGGFFDD
ncbi:MULTISPECIES: hypothetical protein [Microbacterium]|uniref:hypothetical protein n=1 Tax=Microbacterium TaxID=33882 RepID=UPI0027827490|nr:MULTISPECIES: hypothetical protein [Microbacterium]MDQ1085232.1 hypothetical protein [Microbacterium sp. SORGH_AS_0344]MDQ1169462.1 hypothetical protein [Microbacterium proteolyticum]